MDSTPAPPSAHATCESFGLGTPRGPLIGVSRGGTHRVWRLTTTRGVFAVKALNRDFDNPDYLGWYERALPLELAAFDAGVPMARPIPVLATGRCLAELPGTGDRPTTVRVHEWVDGSPVGNRRYQDDTAAEVGTILARIHHLNFTSDAKPEDMLRVQGEAHWLRLVGRLEAARIVWSNDLVHSLAIIGELEAFVVASRADVGVRLLSHRDAHQNNVLVGGDGRLILLDWDAVGPVSPSHDVAHALLDWAGVQRGERSPRLARAVVAGYRRGGGGFDALRRSDFGEFICVMLNWCEFNVRRTLGERAPDEASRAAGERNARQVLRSLARFARSLDDWVALAD